MTTGEDGDLDESSAELTAETDSGDGREGFARRFSASGTGAADVELRLGQLTIDGLQKVSCQKFPA